MKTYELLKMWGESNRLKILLHMSVTEVLNVAKDTDMDIYHELSEALSKLTIKLN